MVFKTNAAPYQRTKKSTLQIMIELGIALAIIWIAAIVTTFIKLDSSLGIKSILLMVVSLITTALCDVVTTLLKNKFDKSIGKKIVYDLIHNYSWITAMIFTLLCPVWTDYYVVIVGSIFSTLIVKNIFGGFGNNIFNPAALGRIFIQLCFNLAPTDAISSGIDTTTGSTITGVLNSTQQWLGSFPIDGFSTWDILLGNYFGTMGETFTILLLVLGIILAIRGVINWRAPVFYLGTIAVSSLLIGLVLGFSNPLLYVVFHIGLGGAAFGAVFMLTDPVTTPTSPFGNCLVGIFAALITMLTRIATNGVEGVVYSIALVNLISPTIDLFITGKTNKNYVGKSLVTFGSSLVSIAMLIGVAWVYNGGREVNTINGISRTEYDELVSYTNFNFMEENNYSYSLYTKEIDSSILVTNGHCQKAYSIVDEALKEVGVLYSVTGTFSITMGEYESRTTCNAYVAISTENNQIMGISLAKGGFSGATFGSKVNDYLSSYEYNSKNFLEEDITSAATGVSYSLNGIKQIAQSAYDLYVTQYGNN